MNRSPAAVVWLSLFLMASAPATWSTAAKGVRRTATRRLPGVKPEAVRPGESVRFPIPGSAGMPFSSGMPFSVAPTVPAAEVAAQDQLADTAHELDRTPESGRPLDDLYSGSRGALGADPVAPSGASRGWNKSFPTFPEPLDYVMRAQAATGRKDARLVAANALLNKSQIMRRAPDVWSYTFLSPSAAEFVTVISNALGQSRRISSMPARGVEDSVPIDLRRIITLEQAVSKARRTQTIDIERDYWLDGSRTTVNIERDLRSGQVVYRFTDMSGNHALVSAKMRNKGN